MGKNSDLDAPARKILLRESHQSHAGAVSTIRGGPLSCSTVRNPSTEARLISRQGAKRLRTNWFIILESRGAWWIDNEGTEFGPFASKEVASREARNIVRTFGDKSRRSRVYWPDEQGRQQLIWESS